MESDLTHGTTEAQMQNVSNSLEQVAMQFSQNMLPGLNFMTASFPMGEVSLNGQSVLQSLQQLGAVPFFTQGGGQLLMQTGGMPVLFHPGFTSTLQTQAAASSPQTPSTEMSPQASNAIDSTRADIQGVTDIARFTAAQVDNSLLQNILQQQQQQQQFPLLSLSQVYVQQQPTSQLSVTEQPDINQTNAVQFAAVTSQATFIDNFNNVSLTGFSVPVAFASPTISTSGSCSTNISTQDSSAQKPPKKPLTPYMRFSKEMWQSVKVASPDLSVCEVGAKIGRLWRELTAEQKDKYNEEFNRDKSRYDEELHQYLKATGLQASDLAPKSRSKKKESHRSHNAQSGNHQQNQSAAVTTVVHTNGTADQNGTLPTFSQVWASNQKSSATFTSVEKVSEDMTSEPLWSWQTIDSKVTQPVQTMLPMYNPLSIQGLASTSVTGSQWQEPLYRTGSSLRESEAKAEEEAEEDLAVGDTITEEPIINKPHYASSQVHFNSYAANPWNGLPVSVPFGEHGIGDPVVDRAQLLESELKHLRYALREKVTDVGRLKDQLNHAKLIISELQHQMLGNDLTHNHDDINEDEIAAESTNAWENKDSLHGNERLLNGQLVSACVFNGEGEEDNSPTNENRNHKDSNESCSSDGVNFQNENIIRTYNPDASENEEVGYELTNANATNSLMKHSDSNFMNCSGVVKQHMHTETAVESVNTNDSQVVANCCNENFDSDN